MRRRAPLTTDSAALRTWQAERTLAWSRLYMLLIGAGLVLVAGRVLQLKLRPDPRMAAAVGNPASVRHDPARRGDLLDRRDRVLATTSMGYRLFLDPEEVEDIQAVALDVGAAIGRDPVGIDRAIIANPGRRYVVVEHLLEDWQVDAVRNAALRGIGLEPRPVRHYPFGSLAAGLIGTVGFEHTGLSGMEFHFDDALLGLPGRLAMVRDARRRPIRIDSEATHAGRDGHNVQLSIDLVVQDLVERRLQQAVHEHNAGGGRMVVLDVATGEILAMHDVLTARPGWEEQTEDPARALHPALGRNRGVTDPYEPGSTFKPFIWSVATELGRAVPDEILNTPTSTGHITGYGRRIRDTTYYGPSTWRRVLVKSMNSGMAIVSERLSYRDMQAAIARFGFGEKTRCGLPGESRGLTTSPEKWNDYTQSSVAMGHEIGVTPVQMVRAFSAFARDGTMPALRLTAAGKSDLPILRRAVPEEIAMLTREIMRDVMTEGTGRRAQSDRYQLFGKSGTAQLPRRHGGGYHEDRYVSSFIAGAPFAHPRLVALCVIDDPDKAQGHYGGAIAGPVVRDVLDGALEYLGIPPDKESVGESEDGLDVPAPH